MGDGGPSTNNPGSMSMPGVPTPMGPGMNQQIPSGGPMLMGNTPNNNNSNENGENNGNNGNNGGNDANATRNNPNMVNNRGAVHALMIPMYTTGFVN